MKRCFISAKLRPLVPGATFDTQVTEELDEFVGDEEFFQSVCGEGILLLSSEYDKTSLHFYEYCESKKIPIVYLTFEYLFGSKVLVDRVVSNEFLKQFRGIYYRPPSIDDHVMAPYVAVLESFIEFFPGNVVNRPKSSVKNISKPWQMADTIMKVGTAVKPIKTLLTNNPDVLARCNSRQTIAKSISDVRSTVKVLGEIQHDQKCKRLHSPIQVQKKLNGFNIRVHVIGQNISAIKVDSDSIDYRVSDFRSFSEISLPEDVKKWCLRASKAEKLEFAGVDLFRSTKDQAFYCFEINPSPGYHFYEKNAKLDYKITNWIVDYLIPKSIGE
ncbi:MAG: RimK family alpha-L-glutamate ligase [Oligoflexales bacterium]